MRPLWCIGIKNSTSRVAGEVRVGGAPPVLRFATGASFTGPRFLSGLGSFDPSPADRGWETVGTASAELPRPDVHPASPQPPQSTRSGTSSASDATVA